MDNDIFVKIFYCWATDAPRQLSHFSTNIALYALAVGRASHSSVGATAGAEGRTRTGTDKSPKDFKSFASTYSATPAIQISILSLFLEAAPGFEPGRKGFADPCLTTW